MTLRQIELATKQDVEGCSMWSSSHRTSSMVARTVGSYEHTENHQTTTPSSLKLYTLMTAE
jgi:hypothetical protein